MDFDYKAAFHKVARPAFSALPPAVHALLARTEQLCANLHQDSTLAMPWPEDPTFRAAFEALDSETLAKAARAVYYWGHWNPNGGIGTGAYWKFSDYADQVLSARLGLMSPHASTNGNGIFVRCLQGQIRYCWSTPWSWQWEEMALATEESKDRLQRAVRPSQPENRWRKTWEAWADAMEIWAKWNKQADEEWNLEPYHKAA